MNVSGQALPGPKTADSASHAYISDMELYVPFPKIVDRGQVRSGTQKRRAPVHPDSAGRRSEDDGI